MRPTFREQDLSGPILSWTRITHSFAVTIHRKTWRRGVAKRAPRSHDCPSGRLYARYAASVIALNPGAHVSQHKRWNAVPMSHVLSGFAVVKSMKEPEPRIMSSQRVARCSHTTAAPPIGISQTVTFRLNFANFAMTKAYAFDRIMGQYKNSGAGGSPPGVAEVPEARRPVAEKRTYQDLHLIVVLRTNFFGALATTGNRAAQAVNLQALWGTRPHVLESLESVWCPGIRSYCVRHSKETITPPRVRRPARRQNHRPPVELFQGWLRLNLRGTLLRYIAIMPRTTNPVKNNAIDGGSGTSAASTSDWNWIVSCPRNVWP
jgi:hypothetical protein